MNYPTTEEAIEAGMTLAKLLRDGIQPADVQPGLHAAWVVAGGALFMLLGEPNVPPYVVGTHEVLTDGGRAEAIESAVNAIRTGDTKAIPWGLILAIAMKLIERFLPK